MNFKQCKRICKVINEGCKGRLHAAPCHYLGKQQIKIWAKQSMQLCVIKPKKATAIAFEMLRHEFNGLLREFDDQLKAKGGAA